MRSKMLNEIFDNLLAWLKNGTDDKYRRKKNYGYTYLPFDLGER